MSSLEQYLAVKTRDRASCDTLQRYLLIPSDARSVVSHSSDSLRGFDTPDSDYQPQQQQQFNRRTPGNVTPFRRYDGEDGGRSMAHSRATSRASSPATSNYDDDFPDVRQDDQQNAVNQVDENVVVKEGWLYRRNQLKIWKGVFAQLQKHDSINYRLVLFKDNANTTPLRTIQLNTVSKVSTPRWDGRRNGRFEFQLDLSRGQNVVLTGQDEQDSIEWAQVLSRLTVSNYNQDNNIDRHQFVSAVGSSVKDNEELKSVISQLESKFALAELQHSKELQLIRNSVEREKAEMNDRLAELQSSSATAEATTGQLLTDLTNERDSLQNETVKLRQQLLQSQAETRELKVAAADLKRQREALAQHMAKSESELKTSGRDDLNDKLIAATKEISEMRRQIDQLQRENKELMMSKETLITEIDNLRAHGDSDSLTSQIYSELKSLPVNTEKYPQTEIRLTDDLARLEKMISQVFNTSDETNRTVKSLKGEFSLLCSQVKASNSTSDFKLTDKLDSISVKIEKLQRQCATSSSNDGKDPRHSESLKKIGGLLEKITDFLAQSNSMQTASERHVHSKMEALSGQLQSRAESTAKEISLQVKSLSDTVALLTPAMNELKLDVGSISMAIKEMDGVNVGHIKHIRDRIETMAAGQPVAAQRIMSSLDELKSDLNTERSSRSPAISSSALNQARSASPRKEFFGNPDLIEPLYENVNQLRSQLTDMARRQPRIEEIAAELAVVCSSVKQIKETCTTVQRTQNTLADNLQKMDSGWRAELRQSARGDQEKLKNIERQVADIKLFSRSN